MRDDAQSRQDSPEDADLSPAEPPSPGDPRLQIPEVLRTPIVHPSKQARPRDPVTGGLSDVSKALAVGFDFLFMAIAGGALGWLVDYWAGSSPWGLLIGLIVGFGGGTVRLIQRTNREDREAKAAREGKSGKGPVG